MQNVIGFAQKECLVCRYSSINDGLIDLGGWPQAPSDMRPPVCAFCAVCFTPTATMPAPLPIPTVVELIGAWNDFSEKLLNYHGNLSRLYHRAKVQGEPVVADVLRSWAYGDISGGLINDLSHDKDFSRYEALWETMAYERLLTATATAYGHVEALWETNDVEGIRRAIERPEVRPLWEYFLTACANRPPREGMTQHEAWCLWIE